MLENARKSSKMGLISRPVYLNLIPTITSMGSEDVLWAWRMVVRRPILTLRHHRR